MSTNRKPLLSPANADTLNHLRALAADGTAPTLEELATACGIGVSTARYHLEMLEKKGAIRRAPGVARGIEIVESA